METTNLHSDLQTLAARWGVWQKALRHVKASEADIRAILTLADNPYYQFTARAAQGRVASAMGFVRLALDAPAPEPVDTPACTWAQLDTITTRKPGKVYLTVLLRKYKAETGMSISVLGVRKVREKGHYTPKTAAFLNWCAKYL